MWNAYYHFFITSADFELIQEHAWHLLQYAGTTRAWLNSPYGNLIRMCSENTLSDVRSVWQHYAESKHMRIHEEQGSGFKQGMMEAFQTRIGPIATYASAVRCAGVHAFEAQQVLDKAFKAYWKTGVVAGNRADESNLENDQGGFANPLFAWSSAPDAGFAVHYGTDCVAGFHLAPAFDHQASADEVLLSLVRVVQDQFYTWCRTFVRLHANVSISLFSGDAVNFCHELHSSAFPERSLPKHMYRFIKPWSATPLNLDNDWVSKHSTLYHVIDTSNLIDHLGLLNVLPASFPLLDKSGYSILYTESLLSDTDSPHATLSEQLAVDVEDLSLLIGLAPMGMSSGVTSDSPAAELLLTSIMGSKRCRIRVPWRTPTFADPHRKDKRRKSVDATELASWLLRWYNRIFSKHETLERRHDQFLHAMSRGGSDLLCYYSRVTLISLINMLKTVLWTDWTLCLEHLVDLIAHDRTLLLGMNNLQDLTVQMHISGVLDQSQYTTDPRALATEFGPLRQPGGEPGLLGNARIPGIASLVLVVPRSKLQVFTRESALETGTPGLHVSVYNGMEFENSFHTIDATFGRLQVDPTSRETLLEEDPLSWRGDADLIVSCFVPTFPFLVGPRNATRAALVVNSSLLDHKYIVQLGFHLRVHDVGLDDGDLYLLEKPLGSANHDIISRSDSPNLKIPPIEDTIVIKGLNTDKSTSLTITFRCNGEEADVLSRGTQVRVLRHSLCTMALFLGDIMRVLEYPYPIKSTNARTRISRKQHWIEVTVHQSLETAQFYQMPILQNDSEYYLPDLWELSVLDPDQQSAIAPGSSFPQLAPSLSMSLSNAERRMNRDKSSDLGGRAILDVKESIHLMVTSAIDHFATHHQRRPACFGLLAGSICDVIFVIQRACHDLHGNSVVLDGFVVPLDAERTTTVGPTIKTLLQQNKLRVIPISKAEMILWKYLLPTLVERCRFNWTHGRSCLYRAPNARVPISTAVGQIPICSCGQDKQLSLSNELATFNQFATRIALSPLCALIYQVPMIPDDRSSQQMEPRTSQPQPMSIRSAASGTMCDNCGLPKNDLKVCQQCRKARYCDRSCQKQHWKIHKTFCKNSAEAL